MKQFIISTLPEIILCVDTSDAGPPARFLPSLQFESWSQAEKHFLALGAPSEKINAVKKALKKTGVAQLFFPDRERS
jgi:hypothetical protein